MTMTAERDLRDQIAMLDDAIAEGSPAADRLREIRATKIEQLSRATGTQYHPTDDVPFAGRRGGEPASNQSRPSGRSRSSAAWSSRRTPAARAASSARSRSRPNWTRSARSRRPR
ncbi:MAG TPA: hypothetical protein VFT75_18405 [Nocardioidaceae bacterium]|nr:hypothetical protein [Nocardioidaceae bacterium]